MEKFCIEELDISYKSTLKSRFNNEEAHNIIENLKLVNVIYYDFNNNIKEGKLVCNKIIAEDLLDIFTNLYINKYQIEKIKLIDDYEFDDAKSMADNNSSCFNYRKLFYTDELSKHAYGLAVDINPLYNPYIVLNNDNEVVIYPENGKIYANRKLDFEHKIDENDLCCKLFKSHGFIWGGDWEYQDYQHFDK